MAENWQTLDAAGRRHYLLATGVKVHVDKVDGQMKAWITGDPRKVTGAPRRAGTETPA